MRVLNMSLWQYFSMIKDLLKQYRKEKNLTQERTAEILNISRTGYASWEQGLSEPNMTDLRKICVLFDISADELLEIENEMQRREIEKELNK